MAREWFIARIVSCVTLIPAGRKAFDGHLGTLQQMAAIVWQGVT